ncbi:hypothetical protein M5689_019906 [Euphorbia peplus]|nr:hypothetical protein M5689_019906 [Euphorbia peplus]
MVARLMCLGDDEGNPAIIRHPLFSDDYNNCIEAGGPSGVFNSDSCSDASKNGVNTGEERDDSENQGQGKRQADSGQK